MKQYLIVGQTLHESMYVFDYMLRLLRGKVERATKVGRTIHIDDYVLKFSCTELYERYDRIGSRAEVIPARHVERLLDMYRTFTSVHNGRHYTFDKDLDDTCGLIEEY